MAIAILSIPPESVEPEWVFSGARRSCSWDRLSLRPEKIEIIESLGSWIREGLIKPTQHHELDLAIEDDGAVEDDADVNTIDEDIEISTLLDTF